MCVEKLLIVVRAWAWRFYTSQNPVETPEFGGNHRIRWKPQNSVETTEFGGSPGVYKRARIASRDNGRIADRISARIDCKAWIGQVQVIQYIQFTTSC